MSGGSYDYLCYKMGDAAESLCNDKNPLRRAFGKKLQLFATAMHDIEWVDSDDYGPGDEEKAIKLALGKESNTLALLPDAALTSAMHSDGQERRCFKKGIDCNNCVDEKDCKLNPARQ